MKRKIQIISLILVLIMILPIVSACSCNGCKKNSEVKLVGVEGRSGKTNDDIKMNELFGIQLADTITPGTVQEETGYIDGVVPQGLVLFDDAEYGELTIKLDNPKEYYIYDLRIKCELDSARILVDNNWIKMDGETKIRWSGATNSSATYKIYLPKGVATERTGRINILDMRYGDDRIQVDLSEKNAAFITQTERPMNIELVSNGKDAIKYKLTLSNDCTITQIDGDLIKNEEDGSYEIVNATGKFVINYTYSIFGETIQSKYISNENQKITVAKTTAILSILRSESIETRLFDTNMNLMGIPLIGTGLYWNKVDSLPKSEQEKYLAILNWKFCSFGSENQNSITPIFEISINDGDKLPAYYFSVVSDNIDLYFLAFKLTYTVEEYKNVKLYLNGYLVFDSDSYLQKSFGDFRIL